VFKSHIKENRYGVSDIRERIDPTLVPARHMSVLLRYCIPPEINSKIAERAEHDKKETSLSLPEKE